MKKNKGFTLVELLAVLTILAIIALITYPIVTKTINISGNSTYDRQVEQIEKAAANWFVMQKDTLSDPQHYIIVDLDYLLDENYLDKDEIINAKTGKKLTGCVYITYKSQQYQYEFKGTDCECHDINFCKKYQKQVEY